MKTNPLKNFTPHGSKTSITPRIALEHIANRSVRQHGLFAAAMCAALLFASQSAQAASSSWNVNAAGNWNAAGSWNNGIPGSTSLTNSTDIATFGFPLTAARIVTVDTNRNIGGITFSGTANFAYTLSSGNLLLTNGGIIQTTSAIGTITDTISSPITIEGDGGSATFTANGPTATSLLSIVAVTGTSTGQNGVTTLNLTGSNAGANVISGIIGDGAAGGQLAVVKSDVGNWSFQGANTFTGGLTIKNGSITALISASSLGGAGTGTVTLGDSAGGSNNATLVGGLAGTFANPIALAANTTGTLTISNAGANISPIFSGGVTGNNSLTINSNSGTGVITFSTAAINNSGTITNIGSAAGTTTISGGVGSNVTAITDNSTTSALTISTTALTVNAGGTTLANNSTGTVKLTLSANVTGNGNLTLDNNTGTSGGITLSGSAGNSGVINIAGTGVGQTTMSGPIGSSVTAINQNSATSTVALSGLINVASGGTTLTDAFGAATFTPSGGVAGSGNLILANNGSVNGRLTLSTASVNNTGLIINSGTGTGSAVISTGGVGANVTGLVENSTNSAFNITGLLTVNAAATTLTNSSGGSLITASGGVSGTGNLILNNDSSTAAGITLSTASINNVGTITNSGTGTGDSTISFAIGTNVTELIENSASSPLILSGANTFNGGLLIQSGTAIANVSNVSTTSGAAGPSANVIALGGTGGSAAASLLAGTFTVSNNINLGTTTGLLTLGNTGLATAATFSGAIALGGNNLTFAPTGTGSVTSSGGISGMGNLIISDGGTTAATTISTNSVNNTGTITNNGAGTGLTTISSVIGTSVTGVIENSASSQLTLSGPNTWSTGGLTILSGQVNGSLANSFGAGTITIGGTNGSASATLNSTGAVTETNPITVAAGSSGLLSIADTAQNTFSGNVALNNNLTLNGVTAAKTVILSGTVTQGGSGNLNISMIGAGGAQISGPVILGSSGLTLTDADATNGVVFTVSGGVTGTGDLTLDNNSAATLPATVTVSTVAVNNTGQILVAGTASLANGVTISAPIGSNVSNIVDTAAGGLTLSGATVSNTGNITFSGSGVGAVTFSATAINNTGSITNNGTTSGATTISGAIGTTVTGVTQNSATSPLVLSGANTFTSGLNIQNGTVQVGSATGLGAGTVTIGTATTAGILDLSGQTATVLSITTSGTAASQTIGNSSTTTAGVLSYTGAGSSTFGGVIKDVLGSGTKTTGVTVNNATGSLTLAGSNTYTGPTTISNGTLNISGQIGGGGSGGTAISVSGAIGTTETLTESAVNAITGASSLSMGGNNSGSNNIVLSKANNFTGAITFGNNAADILTLSDLNAIANAASISSAGAGTLQLLSNASGTFNTPTFTAGPTSTIFVSNNGSNTGQTLTMSGAMVLQDNRTLSITGSNGYILGLTTVTLPSGGVSGSTLGPLSANVTVGNITNASVNTASTNGISLGGNTLGNVVTGNINNGTGTSLTKVTSAGTGIWTLEGGGNYSGATAITSGAIDIASNGALGSTSGVTVASGGALQISNNITTTNPVSLSLIGTGLALTPNNGALENVSGNNTYSGLITLTGAATIGADAGSTLNLTNTGTITGATFGLTLTGAGNGIISSVIGTTTGALTKNGSGTWTLAPTASNTFSGTTTVSAGTLQLIDTATIGGLASADALTMAGGTLVVAGTAGSAGAVTQNVGTFALSAATSSAITLTDTGSANATFLVSTGVFAPPANGTTLYLNLVNSGTGAFTMGTTVAAAFSGWAVVADSGGTGFGSINANHQLVRDLAVTSLTGTSNSSATNFTTNPSTDNGANQYSANTLTMTSGGALNSLFINAATSGTLALNGQTVSLAGNALGMSGTGNYTISGLGTLSANNVNTLLTISQDGTGILTINSLINPAGSGGLNKGGTGSLVLGGANTYTGATTIAAGTLQLGSGGSINSGNALTTVGAGIFDLNGNSQTLGLLTNGATVTNSGGGTPTLTIGNNSTGGGNFTGAMNIIWNEGGNSSALTGNWSNTGNITLNSNGAGNITVSTGYVNNTGTITNSGAGAGTATISANIGPSVSTVTENSNTSELFLSGVDSYGSLVVKSGTVSVGSSSTAAGSGTITLGDTSGINSATFASTINGGNFANPIVLATNPTAGTLTIAANTNAQTFTGGVTGANSLTIANNTTGALTFSTGAITNTGNLTFSANSTGAIAISAAVNNAGLITNNGAGTGGVTLSGGIGSLATGVTENSPGSALTITTDFNTYSGVTKVLAGALVWSGLPQAGNTPLSTGNVLVGDVSGVNSAMLVSGLAGNGGGILGNNITVQAGSAGGVVVGELGGGNTSGGFTYTGGITLNRNIWLANGISGGGGGSFSGNITDAAGSTNTISLITSSGDGVNGGVVQKISGAGNTWGGGTIVDGGVWGLTSASALGTGNLTVNGGSLDLGASTNLASGKTATVNNGGYLGLTGIFDPTSQITVGSSGALGIDIASYNIALNMANIGNGSMFLGGFTTSGTNYAATSLGVGSGNTYRLGAGGGTTTVFSLVIAGANNVLTGASAALVVGSTLANAPESKAFGWVTLKNANNYGGGTTINQASNLEVSLLTGTSTALGSTTAGVTLNGGGLQLDTNAAATSSTIGTLTFNGGSALTFTTATSATNTFTVGSLVRSNNGTLLITDSTLTSALGGVAQLKSTVAPATDTTGMAPAYFYDLSAANFLAYGANGFADTAITTSVVTGSNVRTLSTTGTNIGANTSLNSLVLGNSFAATNSGFTLTVGGSGSTAGIGAYGTATLGGATAPTNFNLQFGTTGTAEGIFYTATGKQLTVDAVIGGSGGLTVSGPGSLALTPTGGSNTFTGQVTIDQGTLIVGADSVLGATGNVVVINGGILALSSNGNLASSSRTITIGANGATIQTVAPNNPSADTIAAQITGSGPFMIFDTAGTNSNTYVFTLTNTANSFTAPIFIDQIYAATAFTLSIGADSELGNAANAVNISSGATLQVTGSTGGTRGFNFNNLGGIIDVTTTAGAANKYTIGGVISGDGNLTKISSGGLATGGILELTAANTLTGGTIITGGSVLLGNANALQNSAVGVGVNGGLTFDPSITTFTIGGLAGFGNIVLADTGGNPVTLDVGNNNQNITYSGILSGTGGLTKIGTGTETLSGLSTYTSPTHVQGGGTLLNGNSAGALPSATTLYIGGTDNSTGAFDLGGNAQTVAGLNSLGNAGSSNTVTNSGTGNATLTVSNGGSFAGNIKDGATNTTAFTVSGGSMALTGNNTYSGATNVTAGTLIVSGSLSGTGAVGVSSAATLGGGGMIAGATTVSGTLNPGVGLATVTTLTINNTVTFNNGSTFAVNIDSTNNLADTLSIGGISHNLVINGTDTLTFDIVNGGSLANLATGTYVIATYTGTLTGAFATDATLQAGWSISYATPDQVDLVVAAVPEPGTYGTLLSGIALLAFWRKLRRGMANPFAK